MVPAVRAAWLLACLPAIVFLLVLLALTSYAAPEHDDFCFASLNASSGFVATIIQFYNGLTGRIVPLFLLQLPGAISTAGGMSLLSAYSITLAIIAAVSFAAMYLTVSAAFPRVGGLPLAFLGLTFVASILGASPSVRDQLYWLPAVVCYVPPALATIFILGRCVYAVRDGTSFSGAAACLMAAAGFAASLCNEFTGVWLLLIIACSLLLRRVRGQPLQFGHHLLIAIAILAGWVIIVLAPGNSLRMAAQPNGAGHIGRAFYEAFRFSLVGLGRFLREPAILGWLIATGLITLAASPRPDPARADDRKFALGITALALFCCYFEYFAHEYSTGMRIIERAQNQALILLLFSTTLTVAFLTETFRANLRSRYDALAALEFNSLALPSLLGLMTVVSLAFSSTGSLLRRERSELYDYHQESVQRHILLATSKEQTVAVPKHRVLPSLLMSADVTANTECIARYYGKSTIIPVEPR
ncbi:DUF6056 family protein [Bradyrhizobium sp.]|uniref:DUF6056 family protein n=1 Tax=Bradyrhizobium sp. TaxID=376 RepID=UPI0039E2CDC7